MIHMGLVPGDDFLHRVCSIAARGRGKQLPVWIPEDQGPHGRVSDTDNVL